MTLYEIYKNIPDPNLDFATMMDYIREHACQNRMYKWIANHFEIETMHQILEHGMISGFNPLINYKDTCEFYDNFSEEIWDMLYTFTEEIGESRNIMHTIFNLNGSKAVGSDYQFKNLLCWFAVEETCRMFIVDIEGQKE